MLSIEIAVKSHLTASLELSRLSPPLTFPRGNDIERRTTRTYATLQHKNEGARRNDDEKLLCRKEMCIYGKSMRE